MRQSGRMDRKKSGMKGKPLSKTEFNRNMNKKHVLAVESRPAIDLAEARAKIKALMKPLRKV